MAICIDLGLKVIRKTSFFFFFKFNLNLVKENIIELFNNNLCLYNKLNFLIINKIEREIEEKAKRK